jgi:AraC-like DNA-binding protein
VLLEASPDLYLFAIGMDPSLSSEVLRDERNDATVPLHLGLAPDDFRALVARASAIVDRAGVEQPCAELWEHAHWVGKRSTTRRQSTMHVLTRRALSTLAGTPSLGLEPLSAKIRAPACEISRHFHRDVGMTFVRYRMRLRMLHLIHLVDTARMTLVAAAEASGFGSYSQCHRIFQTEVGCSPRRFFFSDFRQQMQQAYDP